MFERTIGARIIDKVNSGKAIVVVGARQVGKTTLPKEILKDKEFLFLDADDPSRAKREACSSWQMKPCRKDFS